MKSLQLRLAVALLMSLLCVMSVLWWQTKTSIRQLAEDNVAGHLEHDAEAIISAVVVDTPNSITLASNEIEPIYLKPYSGQYYRVASGNQSIRSPSLGTSDFVVPLLPSGSRQRIYQVGPMQQPLIIMAYGYEKSDRLITVAVAEDLSTTLGLIADFESRYSVIAAVLFLFLVLVQTVILRKGFEPLVRIQNQLRALERGDRSQIDTDVPREVSALVTEFNWLLNVLDHRLQRSRNALADLAHALKTPLTVLQQLPRAEALQSQPEICQTLVTQTTNMQRLMERVLKRARLAGSGPSTAKFDSQQEIPALIHVLKSMYRDKNLSISFCAPHTEILSIDREDMLELTGNLLDNACKWARSKIVLYLECDRTVRLIVEDDGPGVFEEDIEKLMKRGARLDETVDGEGLGLSIAKLITEQHGGHLKLRRSLELGGFCTEAVLYTAETIQNTKSF